MTAPTETSATNSAEVRDSFEDDPSVFLDMDRDGHGPFRNLCVLYGDFHRPVFLEEFLTWFIRNATKAELSVLRKAVSARSSEIGKGGKKGRPRAQESKDWLVSAKTATWHRIVDSWTWRRIAESEGLKPSSENIRTIERTLSRRQDQYAAIIWNACSWVGVWRVGDVETNLTRIKSALDSARFRQWLWIKAGLFGPSADGDWVNGCKKIVLALVFRGEKAAGEELIRHVNYRIRKKAGLE